MNSTKILLHRLMGINIIKVFSLNALSTFIRMLAGMISVKVVALIIGPSGIALLGQLKNLESILLGLANGGINNGITKYVAEYKDDESAVKLYISNAFKITLIATSVVSVVLIIGCRQLSSIILLTDEYYYVFMVFGVTIILYSLNLLLVSILNGYKQFKKYVIVNICGTVFGLVYAVVLVFLWGLPGAMINTVTYQSIVFVVTLWLCRKLPWLKKDYFSKKLSLPVVKNYLGYSVMTLTTLALAPVSKMLLRGYVISNISATEAGIWEGLNSISAMYLSVITTAFSIYYLPRLSELDNPRDLHNEIFRCYKVFIPLLLVICASIYFLRHFAIRLLFTSDFLPMEGLFAWQLAGDFLKVCSWLLAYIMVAKAQTKMYISTEILFALLYVTIAFSFLRLNGIVGLVQGYFVNYLIYMIAMVFLFRKLIKIK